MGARWCSGLARWTSDLKVGGSTPSPCHRVVSLDKKLRPTLSLSAQVYKWVPEKYCWPRGGTRSIHDGGSDGASYCKPKKIHKPEILDPKLIPGIKISNPKKYKNTEHTSLKKSSNEYFSDPLIATKTRNEKFARR